MKPVSTSHPHTIFSMVLLFLFGCVKYASIQILFEMERLPTYPHRFVLLSKIDTRKVKVDSPDVTGHGLIFQSPGLHFCFVCSYSSHRQIEFVFKHNGNCILWLVKDESRPVWLFACICVSPRANRFSAKKNCRHFYYLHNIVKKIRKEKKNKKSRLMEK
jgi:hypothetical protein